jgi:hypothetical protein
MKPASGFRLFEVRGYREKVPWGDGGTPWNLGGVPRLLMNKACVGVSTMHCVPIAYVGVFETQT